MPIRTSNSPLDDEVESILTDSARLAGGNGECLSVSGRSRWEQVQIAFHTDFGPADQDKDTNQDFVVAWTVRSSESPSGIVWAIAMADGVTASYRAELGAELACQASLARLLGHTGKADAKARDAIDAAGDAIGRVADVITRDPQRYQPNGVFASTWEYMLRKGLLLQTTLTLAWQEQGTCYLAVVGDGGAVVQFRDRPQEDRLVLAAPSTETSRVHAIGPGNRHAEDFDVWRSFDADESSCMAVYTDGVGLGIGADAGLLFGQLEGQNGISQAPNLAEKLIQEWIRTRPGDFSDNLSLAVVIWDRETSQT